MTETIITSNEKMDPVELTIGKGQASGISFNRRFLITNGHVRSNPGFQNTKIINPVGPIDTRVHFVLFRPVSQVPYSESLTVFANHCDTQEGYGFSADYQLYPERVFKGKIRWDKILYLENLLKYNTIPPVVSIEPWQMPIEIHVFRLSGQTAIVTLPGEIFVELGLDLKKHSPFANTMIIELANTNVKYVPTLRAYAEGDYEPLNSILVPGSGEKIVEEALNMLNQMVPK